MSWILAKIRVVSIGLFICVLAPCLLVASSAAHKSPEAVIQLFYKALREGKYAEARQYLSRESVRYEERYVKNWAAIADKDAKNLTPQTVEVSEVTTFSVPEAGGIAVMCSAVVRFTGGSVQQLRIALVKEGDVWKIIWVGKLEVEQAFQDYVVKIYSADYPSSPKLFSGYFEISQRDRRVYLSHLQYSLGNFGFGHKGEYDGKGNYTEKIVVPFGRTSQEMASLT